MKIKKYKLYIFLFLLLAIAGFITLGLPSLMGEISIQTYSDSLTYESIAKYNFNEIVLFSTASNVLGPVLILKLFNYNYTAIFFFNIIIFLFSIHLIFTYYELDKKIFLFFTLCNPLIYFSLFNVNKEIFTLLVMALFLIFLKNKNYFIYILLLVLAYFIRWQLALFFISLLPFLFIDKYYKNRWFILFLYVALISIIYPKLDSIFSDLIEHGSINNDLTEGSGLFPLMKQIQDRYGGYILVFIPKLLQINIGLIKRIQMIGNAEDFWNYFVLLLHNLMSFVLYIYLFLAKRFTFKNVLIYFGMLYAALFTVTPIIQVRYFLPMYILFVVTVAQREASIIDRNHSAKLEV